MNSQSSGPAGGCPPPELIRRVAAGCAAPDEEQQVARHLDACRSCREVFDDALPFRERLAELQEAGTSAFESAEQETPPWVRPTIVRDAEGLTLAGGLRLGKPRTTDYLASLGDYDIASVIGQGGMAVVLKAYEPSLDRHVALKVMSSELCADEVARKRFKREARSAARLHHPNIVTIHTVGEDRGIPFICMEYVPGQSLALLISEQAPLDASTAARYGLEMITALGHAHRHDIVHRDVKPANVLIEKESDRARLTDFGLTRGVQDDVRYTREGAVTGTPWYMSPEQAIGTASLDGRSDLFSAGVVLFEMLAGALPFPGPNGREVMAKIRKASAPDLREFAPGVPAQLARVVEKALRKQPDRRYQKAEEFADDLRAFLKAYSPTIVLEDSPGVKGSASGSAGRNAGARVTRCAACSKSIASRLGVAGECEVCGAPICARCWSARGVRRCREHQDAAEAGEPAGPASARQAEAPAPAGATSPDDSPEESVSAEGARVAEESFLRCFRNALGEISQVTDPISGQKIEIKSWQDMLTSSDDLEDVQSLLKHPTSEEEVRRRYPVRARLEARAGSRRLTGRKPRVVIVGRSLSRIEQYCGRGQDSRPLTRTELEAALNESAARAREQETWRLLVLHSPTGWEPDARAYVTGDGATPFRDRYVSPALFDRETEGFLYNPGDERLAAYRDVLSPRVDRAVLERARRFVLDYVDVHASVSLDTLCAELSLGRRAGLRVLRALGQEQRLRLEEVQGVGTVLYRAS